MHAVEVMGLRKSYGAVEAVRGIDLTIRQGEVFGLLGPNGAGKTTTVEILEGHLRADSGSVQVLGHDPGSAGSEFRDRIGIVLQESGIERDLTVREALKRLAVAYSNPRSVSDVIDLVALGEKADARIKTLSGGQRRRFDLAAGLIGRPDLLFLDEPTTGFDPAARRDAWTLIGDIVGEGTTVLLTTHYLEEAQALAHRLAVIADGVIVAEGDPETLGGRNMDSAVVTFDLPDDAAPPLPHERKGRKVTIAADNPTTTLHRLTSWSIESGTPLERLEVARPSLEDVYLRLIGETP